MCIAPDASSASLRWCAQGALCAVTDWLHSMTVIDIAGLCPCCDASNRSAIGTPMTLMIFTSV
jgi:hypothetical protein